MTHPQIVDYRQVLDQVFGLHSRREDFEDGDLTHRLDRFNAFERRSIPITTLDLEEFSLDEDKIEEYMALYRQTGECPPIVYDEIDGSIIDGIHRANALARCGVSEIEAWVGTETHADPHWQEDYGLDEDEFCPDDIEEDSGPKFSLRP